MKTFREFIRPDKGTLVVFDIDDTLFKTTARVGIRRDGVTKFYDTQEWNSYVQQPGDEVDYSEFVNAKIFHDHSTPIDEVLQKAQQIVASHGSNDKTIVCTARQNFDDKELFLQKFRSHGLDIDKMYVERSGNLQLGSSAKNKRFVFHKYLRSGKFDRVLFFDDDKRNMTMFMALAKQYPAVRFEGYLVVHGKIVPQQG